MFLKLFLCHSGETVGDGVAGCIEALLAQVGHGDGLPGRGADLGDAGSHLAAAHDSHAADVGPGRGGLGECAGECRAGEHGGGLLTALPRTMWREGVGAVVTWWRAANLPGGSVLPCRAGPSYPARRVRPTLPLLQTRGTLHTTLGTHHSCSSPNSC